MKKKDLWFRKLGFYNNPLSIKPAAFHTNLLGYDDKIKDIEESIKNNKLLFIEGKYGEGKTTLLKRLIYTFGGKKKVIYFSCNRIDDRLKVRKLLNGRYGIIGKWFDLRPKDMILLLDEAQSLNKRDCEKLHRYYTSNNFSSIVFVGAEYDKTKFPEVISKEMNHFKLHKITPDDAVTLIRKRIGDLSLMSDDILKFLWEKSGNNARKLLMLSEAVCRYAVEYGEESVSEAMVEKVLKELTPEKKVIAKKSNVKKTKKKSSEKIKKDLKEESEDLLEEDKKDEENNNIDDLDEIEEELAKIDLDNDDDDDLEEVKPQTVKVKKKKRVSPEEALNKSTEELLHDERFY